MQTKQFQIRDSKSEDDLHGPKRRRSDKWSGHTARFFDDRRSKAINEYWPRSGRNVQLPAAKWVNEAKLACRK